MELRHLRAFIVLAEELHFARAAERLNIEQSPLSRTIKHLEGELGVLLFKRDRRGTHLTLAGEVFLQNVRRVFTSLDQATASAKAAAAGYRGTLRIAVSDGAAEPRLAALLARCREEDPEVEIRLFDVPLAEQLRGLRKGAFDAGFARSSETGDDIVAYSAWSDPLVIAMAARHPLLVHAQIPVEELLRYPLVMCHPHECEGYLQQIVKLLRGVNVEPIVIAQASSLSIALTLVAAGYGLCFATATQIGMYRHPDVVARALEGPQGEATLMTYLLYPQAGVSEPLSRFIERIQLGEADGMSLP
ncbi:LysR family transcriptional regulator [Castellaniella sp. S9]|uniref:LysR family transcriptional regulator n=1 Tax=Castellaniella sp. S9 TaxID=2993652 RepID=UPI0022B49CB2|nr:LysR family transcriptional regulator [Castellaniella sp. S9]